MRKQLELDDFLYSDEPILRIVQPSNITHIKLASSEVLDYIRNVKPIPGKTIILVLAMTAGEFYGPNRNGDAWPERPLRVRDTVIPEDAVLPRHYKTFETDAHIFRHHINKDPAKSIGNILKAFYNWKMHRVELLLALDNEKAEDIIEQINSGKFPAVSMGCFAAGTPVTMGDGTKKPIETVRVGDVVFTHQNNRRRVVSVHKRSYRGQLYYVTPRGHSTIVCTEEHPFWVVHYTDIQKAGNKAKHSWVHAKCLTDDTCLTQPFCQTTRDRFRGQIVINNSVVMPIQEIISKFGETEVYNLEVEDDESYVAGGVAVHNCKVPYDVCSICGNKAPSRAQYCEHAKYHMGEFLKNGKRIFVWNPYPKFFDLSIVARPADRLGYMMKKVAYVPEISSAERGERIENLENKLAQLRKLSLISKIIKGNIVASKDDDNTTRALKSFVTETIVPLTEKTPMFSPDTIRYLGKFPIETVLSTLGALGIMLSVSELLNYLAAKNGLPIPLPEKLLSRAINLQTAIFDFLKEFPEQAESLSNQFSFSEEKVSYDLALQAQRWLSARSMQHDFLVKRAAFFARESRPLYTDIATGYTPFSSNVYTFVDPFSGELMRTTEAAIRHSATQAYDIRRKQLLQQGLPWLVGGLLSFVPYVGGFIGAPLMGYATYNIGKIFAHDYEKLPTPYGPIRYGSRYVKTPPFGPTEVTKVSFDHAAALKLALDFAHCPGARKDFVPNLDKVRGNSLIEKIGSCIDEDL